MRTRQSEKTIFLVILIFRFASALFPPAGGVWGGMRAGCRFGFSAAENFESGLFLSNLVLLLVDECATYCQQHNS